MRTPDTLSKRPRLIRAAALAQLAAGLLLAACSRTTIDPLTLAPASLLDGMGLRATLDPGAAEFHFPAELAGGTYRVDLSTSPDLSTDVYGAFGAGDTSPIVVVDPQQRWDKYVYGSSLNWRVTDGDGISSPIQEKHICSSVGFSAEKAVLQPSRATFTFRHRGTTTHYRIDLSTVADMSRDVYVGFGTGQASPVVVEAPTWDKYQCDATLYWRVNELLNGHVGRINRATVACP